MLFRTLLVVPSNDPAALPAKPLQAFHATIIQSHEWAGQQLAAIPDETTRMAAYVCVFQEMQIHALKWTKGCVGASGWELVGELVGPLPVPRVEDR